MRCPVLIDGSSAVAFVRLRAAAFFLHRAICCRGGESVMIINHADRRLAAL